ncbi:gamma-glutamyltransferase [Parasegetibacter sp. NRK P23]|uniref:gamma-glutamyltransferase n=1 Tax=Parasegetibacter sp. NRK P23 TaxID=2942999 RepID=UPI0020430C20|nr:gamma-glutamyltransferase [Parasegetibacter sp. NRK P23]MCM5526991.1 gamma-glutamyltransferase [Parasegetibacter sp. NRK P23]
MNNRIIILLATLVMAGNACKTSRIINPFDYSILKTSVYTRGAVSSAHPLASEAGMNILKQGGNAVDAAIAVQLALAVVYPEAGNIGGGGFMVAQLSNGQSLAIDFRETAPAAAGKDMYLDKDGQAQTNLSQQGHLAAGIPGTIAGLFTAHAHAKLPFKKLIAPAILLAEKGFAITEAAARGLNNHKERFSRNNSVLPVFVKETPWKKGDTLIQKDLAETLKRIRDNGMAGFYEGKTAALIAAEMQRGKGIITEKDLRDYRAVKRTPARFDYKGNTILTMPLPSSGGVLLPQMMKMAELFPLKQYGFHSVRAIHTMTEIERLAYADRAQFLGDADFYPVPVAALTADSYIRKRVALFSEDKAGNSTATGHGIPVEKEETTHLSVLDNEGNAVAVTTTLNGSYGSGTMVAGAGFLLNNEMDDFSIKPGVPNMYGAVGAEANAIAPGKRMLSSMTPTIVLKNNRPFIVTGTPGGTTITTSVFQTLLNLLEFELSPEDAVNAPKFHHQWLPDEIQIEPGFPDTVLNKLKMMGHRFQPKKAIGRTELIVWKDGKITAVADKRGDDAVAGW